MSKGNQSTSLVRVTAWEKWLESFWLACPSFAECAQERLQVSLRTFYPQGQVAPSFLQVLYRAVLQRAIDGSLPEYDAELHGPLAWYDELAPQAPDERCAVLIQVIEGVASGLLVDYRQMVERLWEARPSSLDIDHGAGRVFPARLDAHCAAIAVLFQPQGPARPDPLSLALGIEEAEAGWRDSFKGGGGLADEERALIERLTRSALGDWLGALGEEEQATLEQFQAHAVLLQDQVRRLLAEELSLQHYTRHRVEEEVRGELGIEIDAAALVVRTEHRRNGVPFIRTTALDQLASQGPFLASEKKRRQLRGVPDELAALLTPGFLDRLLARLDPRSGYRERLRVAYRDPELNGALVGLYDIRLQQSAFMARCRGHLGAAGFEQVMRAVRDEGTQGRVSGVLLFPDLRLAGPLLFCIGEDPDVPDSVMLYAPDKPDGQEWIELPSLRQLPVEMAKWPATEAGRAWLLGMINPVDQVRAEQFFTDADQRRDLWALDRDHRASVAGYRSSIEQTVAIRQANHLYWVDFNEAPRWFCEQPLAQRRLIAGMDEDLRLLDEVFQQSMGTRETYQDFARRTVSKDIAAYLRECGVTDSIEPDTILFDFTPGLSDASPRRTLSLLDLALYGYDDNWGLDDPQRRVRSSLGQDLSALRAAELTGYVRRAYLGERYATSLRQAFLDDRVVQYAARTSLYGQLIATTMLRDLQVARAKRMLDEAPMTELAEVVRRLARGVTSGPGGVRRFTINGRPAIGLYVLDIQIAGTTEQWLYTPQAPDGVVFRRYGSFRGARPGAMQGYYLSRLRFKDREVAARRLLRIADGLHEADAADGGAPLDDVRGEFVDYLQSHIDDVEAISNSRHEVIMSVVTRGLLYAALPLGVAFPPLGFALDAVFVAVALGRAVEAVREDDPEAARQYWLLVMAGLWGIALPLAWGLFRAAVWGRPASPGAWRALAGQPRSASRSLPDESRFLNRRNALRCAPENTSAMDAGGVWRGVHASTEPGSQLRYVRQNGRWFQVLHDADNQTLRLVDPRFPNAAYKVPIRQDGWGRWVHNPQVGLRGGGNDVRYLGQVPRAAQAFPHRANPAPARGALQGEGVIARLREGGSDNYLYSLNAQSCVVVTLYNPGSRMGAVIHVDHNIRSLQRQALEGALERIGHVRGNPLKATLVGGDWLSGGADIGGPLRSLLAQRGIAASWDHWSWSSCLGNIYGVSLDLADGATTVFTTTRSAVGEVIDPILREARSGAAGAMAQRGRRFMARFRLEPLAERADGSVRTLRGESATAAQVDEQAFALHLLEG